MRSHTLGVNVSYLWVCCSIAALFVPTGARAETVPVYFGTYTRGSSEGIYRALIDLESGTLTAGRLAGEAVNPSFLAFHPRKNLLYAVGEIANFEGKKTGAVSAFAVDPVSGQLRLLNQQPSGGTGPCHLSVDPTGQYVLVANYSSGSVASLPIRDGGELGPAVSVIQHEGSSVNPQRQAGPHAHSVNLDRRGRFAVVADLGVDRVFVYQFDSDTGRLAPNDPAFLAAKPGDGPRHFAFHPQGKFAYVINELASTVTAMRYRAGKGTLTAMQTISTLPEDFEGTNTTAEVQVHPSGRFVYGSNRGHDSIAVFALDPDSGRLTAVEYESSGGQRPRNFGIDPTGRYLLAANQDSDNVVVFQIDQETGRLEPTGQAIEVPSPVCVKFLSR